MISFLKSILVASLMTTTLVSAKKKKNSNQLVTKEFYKGYSAGAYAYGSGGCAVMYGSYLNINAYSSLTRFKSTGSGVIKQSTKMDGFYMDYMDSTCDDTTVTFRRGSVYDAEDYGNLITKFNIDTTNLKEASIKDLQLPIYENTCSYECTEMCYSEIFGYGNCTEDEMPYLECYPTNCEEVETFLGTAIVSVDWKLPAGTNTKPVWSNSVYRTVDNGYSYMTRSKGNYRYDLAVTITAKLDGVDLFMSPMDYVGGDLSDTKTRSVTKSPKQEVYRRRLELLDAASN